MNLFSFFSGRVKFSTFLAAVICEVTHPNTTGTWKLALWYVGGVNLSVTAHFTQQQPSPNGNIKRLSRSNPIVYLRLALLHTDRLTRTVRERKEMKDRRENIKRQMEGTGNLGEEEGLLGWQRRRRRLRWVAGERWRWRLPRPSLRHAWLKLRSCTCGVGGESGPGHVSNPLSEGFPNWFIKNNGQAFEEY